MAAKREPTPLFPRGFVFMVGGESVWFGKCNGTASSIYLTVRHPK